MLSTYHLMFSECGAIVSDAHLAWAI